MQEVIQKRIKALRKRQIKTEKSALLPSDQLDASQLEAISYTPVLEGQIAELERLLNLQQPTPAPTVTRVLWAARSIPELKEKLDASGYETFDAYVSGLGSLFGNLEKKSVKKMVPGITFQQLDILVESAVSPPPVQDEELVVEEAIVEKDIAEVKSEVLSETSATVEVLVELAEEIEFVKEEEGIQFLVSAEELPAQDPVTESDLLAILARNSIAGLDQGVEEVRPAPPISFISPSLVESGARDYKQRKQIRNPRPVVDQARVVEDPRPILPNNGRMPDSARSGVTNRGRESRPILPDHGRMPDNPKPQVRQPDAIAPAHEESSTAASERSNTLRRGAGAEGSNLEVQERIKPVEKTERFGLSNPGLGRDFQRKDKTRKKMGGEVKQVTGEGGTTFKVQFVPKKKSAEIGL